MGLHEVLRFAATTARIRNPRVYFKNMIHCSKQNKRGVSYRHDLVDWRGANHWRSQRPRLYVIFIRHVTFS
jgi:hypothetical protein